jgi:hypothetical protein
MKYVSQSGTVVEAHKIKAFGNDAIGPYVVFENGEHHSRPLVHGFIPSVGDYFVQDAPHTVDTVPAYVEAGATAIIAAAIFNKLYTPQE